MSITFLQEGTSTPVEFGEGCFIAFFTDDGDGYASIYGANRERLLWKNGESRLFIPETFLANTAFMTILVSLIAKTHGLQAKCVNPWSKKIKQAYQLI